MKTERLLILIQLLIPVIGPGILSPKAVAQNPIEIWEFKDYSIGQELSPAEAFVDYHNLGMPEVIYDMGTYRLFFAVRDFIREPGEDPIQMGSIYHATSTDGINWTPQETIYTGPSAEEAYNFIVGGVSMEKSYNENEWFMYMRTAPTFEPETSPEYWITRTVFDENFKNPEDDGIIAPSQTDFERGGHCTVFKTLDGSDYGMVFTANEDDGAANLYSWTSANGLDWDQQPSIILEGGHDPIVVEDNNEMILRAGFLANFFFREASIDGRSWSSNHTPVIFLDPIHGKDIVKQIDKFDFVDIGAVVTPDGDTYIYGPYWDRLTFPDQPFHDIARYGLKEEKEQVLIGDTLTHIGGLENDNCFTFSIDLASGSYLLPQEKIDKIDHQIQLIHPDGDTVSTTSLIFNKTLYLIPLEDLFPRTTYRVQIDHSTVTDDSETTIERFRSGTDFYLTINDETESSVAISDDEGNKIDLKSPLDLGTFSYGDQVLIEMTLSNSGGQLSFTGTNGEFLTLETNSENVSLTQSIPHTMENGESESFQLEIDANEVGDHSGKLLAVTNDPNHSELILELTFTVEKSELQAIANDETISEGQDLPTFLTSYIGFVNNDDETVIDQEPIATVSIVDSSVPGNYPITLTGGEDDNYFFSYQNGTLTIEEVLGLASRDVQLYPNPTSKSIHWTMDDVTSVEVYSLGGQLLIRESAKKILDVSGLINGTYILHLLNEDNIRILRTRFVTTD